MNNPTFIFDFDGTIADSFQMIISIFNQHAQKFDMPMVEAQDQQYLKSLSSKDIIKLLGAKIIYLPKIMNLIRKELKDNIQKVKPVDGIKEVLDQLHARAIPLGILTSNSCENVQLFLQAHGINYFDFVVSESKFKAKQKRLKRVLVEHNISPESAFYVGDETRDALAAKGCGVTAVAVSWGFCQADTLKTAQPDYLLNDPVNYLI